MTAKGSETVEQRLDEAIQELRDLGRRVDDLANRVIALEKGESRQPPVDQPHVVKDVESESVWSWVGQSRFLPRLAMVSFVLVLALVLRTLTSSGIIDLELGVLLGLGYSTGLVALGWRALARNRRGRRVLTACGAVLMCTVVLEAHGPFGLLPAATADWILVGTIVVVTALGIRYHAESLVAIAVLSAAVSALGLGFPDLAFAHTAIVFFVANLAVLVLGGTRLQWLPWTTFALTLFFWLLWSFKLNVALHRDAVVPEGLFLEWHLPFLLAFTLLYATVAAVRSAAKPHSPGAFHVFVPTANVLWSYAAGYAVVVPWLGSEAALGMPGVALALAHFGVAGWVWRRERRCAVGITAFVLAGAMLLVVATPSALGSQLLALPVWSVAALGLGLASGRCHSAGLRLASYLLQIVTCAYALSAGVFAVPCETMVTSTLVAALLTAISGIHYYWSRRHPPEPGTWLTRFDAKDRGAIALLWIAAIYGFYLLRLPTWSAIDALGVDLDNTFRGAQSVIINLAGIALMLWGIARKDAHLLGTAVLVAVIGGLKVFVSDLFSGSGVPLVLAVFSFGLAAAVGSVVLGKWQAHTREDGAQHPTSDGSSA